jgi:hypothetical protein
VHSDRFYVLADLFLLPYKMSIRAGILLAIMGLLAPVSLVNALDVSPSIGIGMQYTDNAKLAADNEEDDWIASGSLAVSTKEEEGPLKFRLDGTVQQERYLNDSFGDQTNLNLNTVIDWNQIPGRLSWRVLDYFSQTSVDSLGANTPENTQDANVFGIDSSIHFLVLGRNIFTLSPNFRDFYYEKNNTGNQRFGLSLGWTYLLYPTMDVGLSGAAEWVEYDDETINPNYRSEALHAVLNGSGARTQYNLTVGGSRVNRDQFSDVQGASGSAWLKYQLSGRTSIDARFNSSLSDSSQAYLRSGIDENSGNFSNLEDSGDVLRNSYVRVTLQRDAPVLGARAWVEYADQDYEVIANDRKVQEVGINLKHSISSRLTGRVFTFYNRIKDTGENRTDTRNVVGGHLNYKVSRSLNMNFDLRYQDKDSDASTNDYDEFRGFVGLVYGFGKQGTAPGIGRSSSF